MILLSLKQRTSKKEAVQHLLSQSLCPVCCKLQIHSLPPQPQILVSCCLQGALTRLSQEALITAPSPEMPIFPPTLFFS